jgi:hypothetical protein
VFLWRSELSGTNGPMELAAQTGGPTHEQMGTELLVASWALGEPSEVYDKILGRAGKVQAAWRGRYCWQGLDEQAATSAANFDPARSRAIQPRGLAARWQQKGDDQGQIHIVSTAQNAF